MSGPFKMKGHELPGPNQRKKSPMKIGIGSMLMAKQFRSDYPKTSKFINKVGEGVLNVATGGVYGTTKEYVKKQGGLAKTLDKHFPVKTPTREQKKKNTEKIENFVSKFSFKNAATGGVYGTKKQKK
tara:strand:+ start:949 stop:1329 length:381 start_codon:yes stop_codon:yes gene_type:complete